MNGFPLSIQVSIFVSNISLNFRLDQDQGILKTQSLNSKFLTKSDQTVQNLPTYDLVNLNLFYEQKISLKFNLRGLKHTVIQVLMHLPFSYQIKILIQLLALVHF